MLVTWEICCLFSAMVVLHEDRSCANKFVIVMFNTFQSHVCFAVWPTKSSNHFLLWQYQPFLLVLNLAVSQYFINAAYILFQVLKKYWTCLGLGPDGIGGHLDSNPRASFKFEQNPKTSWTNDPHPNSYKSKGRLPFLNSVCVLHWVHSFIQSLRMEWKTTA